MKDIIQQIMNQENLDEIYGYAQNALFKDGPVSITTLEILSYLKLFAPDYFSAVEEEILSIMGIFYKKPTARTLQSKLFNYIVSTFGRHITMIIRLFKQTS